ncbi:MAG: NAD(P)/FAD-dependent oxidoreductase [Bacteroidales bacterium]|nr:NAD(P)/FAD-dependent oxidoreductase [Bacteroidales bacterium]
MYDAIVIGAGVSGLMCANIMSRMGAHVLVLEKEPKTGGMLQGFSRGGTAFDTGLHYVGGLGPGESLEWIFRYHNLTGLPWKKLDYGEEVIINGKSYLIPCGYDNFAMGMAEYFPHQRENLKRFASELKSVSGGIRDLEKDRLPLYERSAAEFLSETISNETLRKVLTSMGPRMEMRSESLPFYEYAMITAPFIESAWRLDAPSHTITDVLAKQVTENGGEIKCGVGVDCITQNEVRSKDQIFKAEEIISSIPPANMMPMVKQMRDIYKKRIVSLPQTGGMFTAYLLLSPGMIPYVNHNISIDNKVFIHFNVPDNQQNWATTLEIMMPVDEWPQTRSDDYFSWKADLAGQAIAIAQTRLPGLSRAVKEIYTSSPLTWQRYTGSASAFGIRKDYRSVLTTVLSPRTPLPHLWLIGQSIGLHGVLGVSMTVLNTLSQIYGLETIRKELSL